MKVIYCTGCPFGGINKLMTDSGWIKLHRKLRDNPIYSNSKAVHVWIECLLRASHKEQSLYLKNQKVNLQPGQFVMGRDEFGESVGMSGSTVWFWIHEFVVNNMLNIKTTTKGTIVTVLHWDKYQKVDSTLDNKKTTKKQQKNTYKNDKNVKNEKNIIQGDVVPQWESELRGLLDFYNEVFDRSFRSIKSMEKNYKVWREIHTVEEIKRAIVVASTHDFWKDKMTLTILLRQKNTAGEPVDYIEDLNNQAPKRLNIAIN